MHLELHTLFHLKSYPSRNETHPHEVSMQQTPPLCPSHAYPAGISVLPVKTGARIHIGGYAETQRAGATHFKALLLNKGRAGGQRGAALLPACFPGRFSFLQPLYSRCHYHAIPRESLLP